MEDMEANMGANFINQASDMCAAIDRLAIQVRELTKAIKEQYSMKISSDIKNDDIRECESVTLRLEEELSRPTLVEDKGNEIAIEEETLFKNMQVEEKHPEIKIENVLVGVDKFNFLIDFFTLGIEEDRKVSPIGRPSIATSQVWIDAEHEEMTFLVSEE